MPGAPTSDAYKEGQLALREGRWDDAATAFQLEVDESRSPDVLEGLAAALWWLGEIEQAIALREEAYAGFKAEGEVESAIRAALWLAQEHEQGMGNSAVANGWLKRAETLLADDTGSSAYGWLLLARAGRESKPAQMLEIARQAVAIARAESDPDLEIRSLARIALALVTEGQTNEGLSSFDEAMVAASEEGQTSLEAIGETYCDAFAILELVGDTSRLEQWSQELMRYMSRHDYGPLVAFCGACCGELFSQIGNVEAAERELQRAIAKLPKAARTRCAHPVAKLAEFKIMQGLDEDADRLLTGYRGLPETTLAEAQMALQRGLPQVAAAVLDRRLAVIGRKTLLSVPYLVLLVEARLAAGDVDEAHQASDSLGAIAQMSRLPHVEAHATRSAGMLALAQGQADALPLLEESLELFVEQKRVLDAANVRMTIARAAVETDPDLAAFEARTALEAFEAVGARHSAASAAELLRRLGQVAPPGPKWRDTLTRREQEVLALVSEGLTNREIADRLYISPKTVGHHVSRILTKLGLKNRSQAAALAIRDNPLT